MQDKPADHTDPHAERRPAVWPWLLIPLVTLALFFGLRSVREKTEAAHQSTTVAPSDSPSSSN